MITPAQCRAARGLLDWSQGRLAEAARVAVVTIRQFENSAAEPRRATLGVVRIALEAAGVTFVDENGEGPGVRFRKTHTDADLDRHIAEKEAAIADIPEPGGRSPEAALATMDKALAENDLIKLKNKRTRRKSAKSQVIKVRKP
jgi:transcriptional regulator with XRE-family HTH domain